MKYFTAIALIFLITACSQQAEKVESKPEKEVSIMYEASELALLMRAMHEQSAQWKKALEQESDAFIFPDGYLNIFDAEATNPQEINEKFPPLAQDFIDQTQKFVRADATMKIGEYNLMITSCINCHENYCRGPIAKISKLYIDKPQ